MSIKINNKSSKPDNIIIKENKLILECEEIESLMPTFMRDYFIYLKSSVAISSRHAYLTDIKFFFEYLLKSTYTDAKTIKDIKIEEINEIKSRDVNLFIGDYCNRYYREINGNKTVYENNNKALARKKTSISTLFKFLYRNEQLDNDITIGFNPIKLPKKHPDSIKRMEIDEVSLMLSAVESGEGLTEKEKEFWQKTKLRDRAILILFVTYGLRLSELAELNLSSFNFSRGEFTIFRKRSKEVLMPINDACEKVIKEYIDFERPKEEKIQDKDKDALFLSLQNKRLTPRAIRELVKKYTSIGMRTSRDKGYSPHKLRATAATSLIQTGFSIYDVQNLLDHDNVTTTQLYAAHKKNAKREIVKNFDWLDDKKYFGA